MVIRNEMPYLHNCLRHLIDNGLDYYVIDNESTDETAGLLASPQFSAHLTGSETFPFDGAFNWLGLMGALEAASAKVDADWLLYLAADEIMHSYCAGETISTAIERISRDGSNVIDFNEFVFLPIDHDYASDTAGYPASRHYYFFEPYRPRLMRARAADISVSGVETGGHIFKGDIQLAPETMALRHYMFRNQDHAFQKYAERTFQTQELARGWHKNRVGHGREKFQLPPAHALQHLSHARERTLDRTKPHTKHYWQWGDITP